MLLQEHEQCLLSICFALFVVNSAYKSFRRAKCVFFSSAFKKITPNNTTPTLQEEGGVAQHLIFC